MDSLLNIRAFVNTARGGSFSSAARDAGVSPSVITKRISQLEHQMGAALFIRSTRKLRLTEVGTEMLPKCLQLMADFDDTLQRARRRGKVEGSLRIKAPSTLTSIVLGGLLSDFAVANPGINLDLVLLDRSVNPVEEGYDLAISARSATYPNVTDVPLSAYPCRLCASPTYLASAPDLEHPRDLVNHQALVSVLYGSTWRFESATGELAVEARPRLSANDGRVLLEAARRGVGIAILPDFVARDAIADGSLVALLPEYPPARLWLKALVPSARIADGRTAAVLDFLRERFADPAIWSLS
jgi:DNA-binding transcriptional LysR family regulator